MKHIKGGASMLDMDPKSTIGGGIEDIYSKDYATDDQFVTPWTISVTRSSSLHWRTKQTRVK